MSTRPTIVLYDGWCSVCSNAAQRLRDLDGERGRLKLVDLRIDDSLVQEHQLDPKEIRRVMHVITPDGRVLVAMDAVRATMQAVGRGWLIAWTRIPLISWVCDRLYLWFANNRLRFFPSKASCENGSCKTDHGSDVDRAN